MCTIHLVGGHPSLPAVDPRVYTEGRCTLNMLYHTARIGLQDHCD